MSRTVVSGSRKARKSVFAGLALALAGALAAACAREVSATDAEGSEQPAGVQQEGVDAATARYERRFLEGMIRHHRMAVEMSATCLEKAEHPELRSLCQSIADAQEREIEDMSAWLQEWYGAAPPEDAPMSERQMHSMHELESLSGAAYEAEFLEEMTAHHMQAVAEGGTCANLAVHEPLVELCRDIVDAQLAEIDEMQSWQREWAGAAPEPAPTGEHTGH